MKIAIALLTTGVFLFSWPFLSTSIHFNQELDEWIQNHANISISYILENIGGISPVLNDNEVPPGTVVASPLKSNPDYFYNWIRDSALTMRTLVHYLQDNPTDNIKISDSINAYIMSSYRLQRLHNRCGSFDENGHPGLGEPKFLANGSQFSEDWGRPQSDGPPLRVSTIKAFLDHLNSVSTEEDPFLSPSFIYTSIVKPDLEYILAFWQKNLFDPWEEINSLHFFNLLVLLAALRDGLLLAKENGDSHDFQLKLLNAFDDINLELTQNGGYVLPTVPYVVETPELRLNGQRKGLDSAVLLASIYAHDDSDKANAFAVPFDSKDSHILNTIYALVADMKYRYPVNSGRVQKPQKVGVGLGRYPEDIYDGYGTSEGNPWFITTLAASEVLYRWISEVDKSSNDLVITSDLVDFFGQFDESVAGTEDVTIVHQSPQFKKLLRKVFAFADSFVEVARLHVDKNSGRMLEQFNKDDGYMQGAESLTWSYSSFYNAFRWRQRAKKVIEETSIMPLWWVMWR